MIRIKICGVTTPADAERAAALGADAIGINFYGRSPRYVGPNDAPAILRVLPPFVDAVGLFVDTDIVRISDLADALQIRTVQVHGDDVPIWGSKCYGIIRAFPVTDAASLASITRYVQIASAIENCVMPAVLVDAHVPGMHGGTGQTAPWRLLAGFDPGVPLILAGGLTPDNVAEAIRIVRPYAVDVASGVESAPGRKDPDKLRRFIENARSAL
jgi:phosphoribosylanthranilate isomerase